jgi:hypothetical protein
MKITGESYSRPMRLFERAKRSVIRMPDPGERTSKTARYKVRERFGD